MGDYISIIEPYAKVKNTVKVDANIIINIVRMLTGTINIEKYPYNKKLVLKESYFSNLISTPRFQRISKLGEIISPDISLAEFVEFTSLTASKNTDFYNNLANEFANYLWYQNKEHGTTAFLFIYRILEHISYSFPLLYTSKTLNFTSSYGYLKSFFEAQPGDKKGELSFFKGFIEKIFTGDEIMQSSVSLNLVGEEKTRKEYYQLLQKRMKGDSIHEESVTNETLCIRWGTVPSLIIQLRNRFFHYTNGNKNNISSEEIIDPDLFFSMINDIFFKWLIQVFNELLIQMYIISGK